jgi:hypothetical protein
MSGSYSDYRSQQQKLLYNTHGGWGRAGFEKSTIYNWLN